jgi:uncharacterized protein YndB with AHSA1/START domain
MIMSATLPNTQSVNQSYGVPLEPGTLRLERLLPGPIERVWSYLVEPEKRRKWFAGGQMEQREGGYMELQFRHRELSQPGEEVPENYRSTQDMEPAPGKVIRCTPPTLLVFEWEFCEGMSEVTFELSPEGESVRLVLTHRRLIHKENMVSVAAGWHTHVGLLMDLLENRERGPFWPEHERLMKEYGERLPEC